MKPSGKNDEACWSLGGWSPRGWSPSVWDRGGWTLVAGTLVAGAPVAGAPVDLRPQARQSQAATAYLPALLWSREFKGVVSCFFQISQAAAEFSLFL